MIKIIDNNIKKITICLLIVLIISILGLIFMLLFNKTSIKTYKNKTFTTKYDSTWTLNKSKSNQVTFKHSKSGLITIKVDELEDKYIYESIDTLIDDIVSGISSQNKNYVLLGEEKVKLTSDNLDGYKLLFEAGDNQVLVSIIKQSNKIITYTYEAQLEYFDILLDSAQNILYNFKLVKEKLTYDTKLENIKTKAISFKGSDTDIKLKEGMISNNNYEVTYKIPSDYNFRSFLSTFNIYYKNNNSINTTIYNLNLYEVITRDYVGVEYEIKRLKENKNVKNVNVETDKLDEVYVYRITYDYEGYSKTLKKELIYKLIPLNHSHTFVFKIETEDDYASKRLIDSLEIVKSVNYSNNVSLEVVNGHTVNELRQFTDYNYNKYNSVTIYTPVKYLELDLENNRFESIYYGYDFKDKDDETSHQTLISYRYVTYDYKIDTIKSSYSAYKNVVIKDEGIKNYGGYKCNVYYVTYSNKLAREVVCALKNKGSLVVKVESQKKITDNMLLELVKFKEELKELN